MKFNESRKLFCTVSKPFDSIANKVVYSQTLSSHACLCIYIKLNKSLKIVENRMSIRNEDHAIKTWFHYRTSVWYACGSQGMAQSTHSAHINLVKNDKYTHTHTHTNERVAPWSFLSLIHFHIQFQSHNDALHMHSYMYAIQWMRIIYRLRRSRSRRRHHRFCIHFSLN